MCKSLVVVTAAIGLFSKVGSLMTIKATIIEKSLVAVNGTVWVLPSVGFLMN